MGLDSVELVMGWEETFGVTIANAEAELIRTPRMAMELFAAKLGATDESRGACLSLRAFARLRQGLVTGANVPRSSIRPEASLGDLIPFLNRKSQWRAVQAAANLHRLPRIGLGGLFLPKTLRELTNWAVAHGASALKAPGEIWTRAEIRAAVRAGVQCVTGVRDFTDDADLIYDLGID